MTAPAMDLVDAGNDELARALCAVEAALLDQAVRRDPEAVSDLLHDDFFEFGRSGRYWSRSDIIDLLAGEQGHTMEMSSPSAVLLSEGIALLTYRSRHLITGAVALRSSIWIKQGDSWKLRFHQGTPSA